MIASWLWRFQTSPCSSMLSTLSPSLSHWSLLCLFVVSWIRCKSRSSCSCIDLETTRRAMCAATAAGESSRQALLQKKNHNVSLISMQSSSWNLLGNSDSTVVRQVLFIVTLWFQGCSLKHLCASWFASGMRCHLPSAYAAWGEQCPVAISAFLAWLQEKKNCISDCLHLQHEWQTSWNLFIVFIAIENLWGTALMPCQTRCACGQEGTKTGLETWTWDFAMTHVAISILMSVAKRMPGLAVWFVGGDRSPRNLNPILHNSPICWES